MRFVAVKSEETQGAASVFRVRELLIRQRTQTINALREHLTEFGEVVPQGAANARRLIALVEASESGLRDAARATLKVLVEGLRHLDERIAELDGRCFCNGSTVVGISPWGGGWWWWWCRRSGSCFCSGSQSAAQDPVRWSDGQSAQRARGATKPAA